MVTTVAVSHQQLFIFAFILSMCWCVFFGEIKIIDSALFTLHLAADNGDSGANNDCDGWW